MDSSLKSRVSLFFSKGQERTVLAKRNIFWSLLWKGTGIIAMLLLVPLTIHYINSAQYGIWLTLSSMIGWVSFLDIGLGNGLRNKLAAANAQQQTADVRTYVSSTYAMLVIIAVGLSLLFLITNPFINWNKVWNSGSFIAESNMIALLAFELFCLQFVAQLVNSVLTACHLAAKVSLIMVAGQLLTLAGVYLLIRFSQPSLFLLVLVSGGAPVLSLLMASIWYYRGELKIFAPSPRLVNFSYARELLGSGGQFFFIQIGALILFQTDNIVITQLFSPAYVTTFNVAYRLFYVFIMGFNIVVTPFWSAFTDAYVKGDIKWIRDALKKLKYLWAAISIAAVGLCFVSPLIYRLWIRDPQINVPFTLSLAMAFYVIVYVWQTIHVYFLNGINKIKLQLYLVAASAALNIPIAIFLGRRIGLTGVTLANALLFLVMGLIFAKQVNKILSRDAAGIWNV